MYHHILLAADFSDHGREVSEKAKMLAEQFQAKLSAVHIVDNLPISDASYGPIIPFEAELSEELFNLGKEQLSQLGKALDIPEDRQWIDVGSPKLEIVRIAEEKKVDIIVIGSHGRHGFARLLGSTAYDVMRHAQCDVLAVRLNDT